MLRATQAIEKLGDGVVIKLGRCEIGAEHRAGKADVAGRLHQGHLQGGEIAVADEQLAAVGQQLVIDVRQQPGHAVGAAQGHHHLDRRVGGGGVQLRHARFVGAAEALVAGGVIVIVMDDKALLLQAGDAGVEGVGVGREAAWRNNGDACRWWVQNASDGDGVAAGAGAAGREESAAILPRSRMADKRGPRSTAGGCAALATQTRLRRGGQRQPARDAQQRNA